MSAPPTRDDTTPEMRAARRGGILGIVLLPVLAALGVMLLALSSLTPVFVPAGVCLILLSAVGVWTGVVALRGCDDARWLSGMFGEQRVPLMEFERARLGRA